MGESTGLGAILGITMIILSISFISPIIVLQLTTNNQVTTEQVEDTTITLTNGLDASVTNIQDDPKSNITVTILDTTNGVTKEETSIDVGDTRTILLSGETIKISHIDKLSNTKSIIQYDYPVFFGWPESAKTLFKNLNTFLMVMSIFGIMGFILLAIEVVFEW